MERAANFWGALPGTLLLSILFVFAVIPLSVTAADSPRFSADGITNAASFRPGAVAPGEIVSIFGSDLGPTEGVGTKLNEEGRMYTSMAGTSVLFDDVPAPLFYVRNDQINLQVPYSVAGQQSTNVQISVGGAISDVVQVPVTESVPGIFAYAEGKNQAVMLNENWTLNSTLRPAKPGSIGMFYATGEGQTDPPGIHGKLAEVPYPKPTLPVSITIGGLPVTDLPYAASAPGFAGLMQINARIPKGVKPGKAVPVTLKIGGRESQPGITIVVASNLIISNVRATGVNSTQDATLTILVDFIDPSGDVTPRERHCQL
jgi:uncharacterized protein (TIGR03437 family)